MAGELKTNEKLTHLNISSLSNNCIDNNMLGCKGAEIIASIISINKTLKNLSIGTPLK